MTHKSTTSIWWTFAITSLALFMVTLDNLVVTTALPVIRKDLHAGISGLEWTVPSPAPHHTFDEPPVIADGSGH